MTTSDILDTAVRLSGKTMTAAQQAALDGLCRSAQAEFTARLRSGVTPDDCGGSFLVACAWSALAGLSAQEAVTDPASAFSAGDVSVRETESRADNADRLRRQAEYMLGPWLRDDGFLFQEVRG